MAGCGMVPPISFRGSGTSAQLSRKAVPKGLEEVFVALVASFYSSPPVAAQYGKITG